MTQNLSIFSKKGVLWILTWCSVYAVTTTLLKFLPKYIPLTTAVFMRTFFGMLVITPSLMTCSLQSLKTQSLWIHGIRLLCTLGALLATYQGYRYLPLSFATAVGFTGPLFTTVFSIFFLKESIRLNQWAFLVLGYIGIIVIINPQNIEFNTAIYFLILANILSSGSIISVKILSRTDSTLNIMVYNIALTFIIMSIVCIFSEHKLFEISKTDVLILFGIGLSGTLAQFCYIKALKYLSPAFVAPFEYLRLLWAIPIGHFVFQEQFSYSMLLGSFIVLISIVAIQKGASK